MKLYYSPPSPFARKAIVAAYEYGVRNGLNLIPVAVSPVTESPELRGKNPLARIPTLVLENGSSLFDSSIIVEYLQNLAGIEPPADRWNEATIHRAADGLMEAALLARYEMALRPEEFRWRDWIAGQTAKVEHTLDWLEERAPAVDAQLSASAIAVSCALAYLDFRFADTNWRSQRPRLASFAEQAFKRDSLRLTSPSRDWSLEDDAVLAGEVL